MKKVVVAGFMATCPIAGVVWQHIHYLLGLKKLGYEPIYIEDTARYPFDAATFEIGETVIPRAAEILGSLAKRFQFSWAYRARFTNPMRVYGDLTDAQIARAFENAQMTLNLCGSQELHEAVLKSKCLVYVESDPGVKQIELDKKDPQVLSYLKSHHAHFTFGENLGQPDCPLPTQGIRWHPTRQPVDIEFWKNKQSDLSEESIRLTTVANWETKGKDIVWKNNVYYWSKTFEFLKFCDVPKVHDSKHFIWEIATDMSRDPASEQLYQRQGWNLVNPHPLSCDFDDYLRYIQNSHAEWTVAKDQYIRLKTGWFSDRSACYLAAGRPVITQDTLFGKFIPEGEGLYAFRNVEDILEATEAIRSDYKKASRKAFEIAQEYFSAEKVLAKMLSHLGIKN